MGVYINGMKMPKCCAECDAEGHYENSYGDEYGFFCPFGYKEYTEETRDTKRLDNCPLVPVPEHGRLIDADALCDLLMNLADNEYTPKVFASYLSYEENAPTVIPAEDGE